MRAVFQRRDQTDHLITGCRGQMDSFLNALYYLVLPSSTINLIKIQKYMQNTGKKHTKYGQIHAKLRVKNMQNTGKKHAKYG